MNALHGRTWRWLAACGALSLVAAACNGEPADPVPDDGVVDEALPEEAPALETPISFEDLATTCEELTDIAEDLRGPPVELESQPPSGAEIEETRCTYLYEDHTPGEQSDEVALMAWREPDGDSEVLRERFDMNQGTEVDGLGDEARYHRAQARVSVAYVIVLAGDTVYWARVTAPVDVEDEPFLDQDPLVEAARRFMDRMGS